MAAVLAVSSVTTSPAGAVEPSVRRWVGASNGLWSVASNWSPAGVPQDGERLVFEVAGSSEHVTVADIPGLMLAGLDISAINLTVNATAAVAVTIVGDVTTAGFARLRVPVALTAGAHRFTTTNGNVVGTGNLILERALTGPGGFLKAGPGTMTLAGANTDYDGTTTIEAGNLDVWSAGSLGSTTAGTTVAAGATVHWNGGRTTEPFVLSGSGSGDHMSAALVASDVAFDGSVTIAGNTRIAGKGLTFNGALKGSGALVVAKIYLGVEPFTFTAPGTFSGSVTLSGRLVLDGPHPLGSGSTTVGGSVTLQNGATVNRLTVDSDSWYGHAVWSTGSDNAITGGLTLVDTDFNAPPVNVDVDAVLTLDGGLHGAGTFRKSGDGMLVLTGSTASTHTGYGYVGPGTLLVDGQAGTPLATWMYALDGGYIGFASDDSAAHTGSLGSDDGAVDLYGTNQQTDSVTTLGALFLGVNDEETGPDYSVLRTGGLYVPGAYLLAIVGGGAPGVSHDQIVVDPRGVTIDGALLEVELVNDVPLGTTVRLIDNRGTAPVEGEFEGLPEGAAMVLDGKRFVISYVGGTGNDVTLTRAEVPKRSGYWMVGAKGHVYAFGDAPWLGNAPVGSANVMDIEATPSFGGYWIVDDLGRVWTFGNAPQLGNAPVLPPGDRVTSVSSTKSGNGYWLFTAKGRAIPFGDATQHGGMHGVPLNGPVLDSIRTAGGGGYYMVASDGGIFTFGDASFFGSMGGKHLNAPVRSLVPDPDGVGYWLVAGDGGVFSFEAGFRGSMGGKPLNKPMVGMVPYGNGYLMVAADGGIFSFSDKPFLGSLGSNPPSIPIVSVAALNE